MILELLKMMARQTIWELLKMMAQQTIWELLKNDGTANDLRTLKKWWHGKRFENSEAMNSALIL